MQYPTPLDRPSRNSNLSIGGIANMMLTVPTDIAQSVNITGMTGNPSGQGSEPVEQYESGDNTVFVGYRHNAFVNQGLEAFMQSAYGDLVSSPITHIALSGDNSAVVLATDDIDPGAAGFSSKVTDSTVRTGQSVSCSNIWDQNDVNFAIVKIGLLTGPNSTDVVNIIGGTGGVAPYDEPFTIDLTTIATWTLQMGIVVTANAS
jgi:hypothetical protein